MGFPPPEHWGKDRLTDFFDTVFQNGFAAFQRRSEFIAKAREIDTLFEEMLDETKSNPSIGQANARIVFMVPSHRAFRTAALLAMTGLLAESAMVARGCLENALYAFYLAGNTDKIELWFSRHEDDEHVRREKLKEIKKVFKPSDFMNGLAAEDSENGAAARKLYDSLIDMGAHPNMMALYAATEFNDVGDGKRLDFHYCSVNNMAQDVSLRVSLQVGVCALKIFERIWKLRFEISGLSEKIGRSSIGL